MWVQPDIIANICKKRGIQVLLKEYAIWLKNSSTELHPAPTEENGLSDFNGSQVVPVFLISIVYLKEFLKNQTGITEFSRS